MKRDGAFGIQGEFGIGLLSFWTMGEGLTLISSGADGRSCQMQALGVTKSPVPLILRRLPLPAYAASNSFPRARCQPPRRPASRGPDRSRLSRTSARRLDVRRGR
jgi:hypothetical protein